VGRGESETPTSPETTPLRTSPPAQPALRAALVLASLLLSPRLPAAEAKPLEIYFIDTEGGAATLIVTPLGESVLVDTGNPGERDAGRIARAAKEMARLEAIDHLIITHWHADHHGGVPRLVELIPVKRFYDHGVPEPLTQDIRRDQIEAYRKAGGAAATRLRPGDEVPLKQPPQGPSLKLRVLAADGIVLEEQPGAPQVRACDRKGHEARPADTSDNARSVAFLLTFGSFDFFDGGDLTWNVEHKLACPRNIPGQADVFQVNHHGLDQSNNPVLLEALKPRVAIINNGARKGAEPGTVAALKASPGLEAIFQLHRNVRTGSDGNAPPEQIANDEETCKGELVRLSVAPDGKAYVVHVPAKGTERRYAAQ
jgi:beta-lactamase superfamily II metal-dependent hydrolase